MKVERVVIINDRARPMGGMSSLALLSAGLLADAGLDVHFVTGDDGRCEDMPRRIAMHALGQKALLEQPMPHRVRNGLYNQAAHDLISQIIARHDDPATVYHVHGWAQTLSPAIFSALRKIAPRLIISAHDFSLACPNGSYFNFQAEKVCTLTPLSSACLASNCDKRSPADKMFRVMRSYVLRHVATFQNLRARIVAVHEDMVPWLERAGLQRAFITTLRNPVEPFCRIRIAAEDNTDLFFIGRVEFEKGVDLAAQAAAAAGRRLRVIGDGSKRAALAGSYPSIVWEGWRSHDEICCLVREARALIMLSRLPEPFGLVAVEALQSGIPILTFEDSLIGAEAQRRGAGLTVERGRSGAIAETAQRINDDTWVAQASRRAFEAGPALATTPLTWRDGLLRLYDEALTPSEALADA